MAWDATKPASSAAKSAFPAEAQANWDELDLILNRLNADTDIVTSVGHAIEIPAKTEGINASGNGETVAIGASIAFGIPTYSSVGTTFTITDASTLYIAGAPTTTGGNVTLTRAYSMWVDAGNVKFDGALALGGSTPGSAGDIDSDGDLTFTGVGPHAIGGATVDYRRLGLLGSFTSLGASTESQLVAITGALTLANGDTGDQAHVLIAGSVTTQDDNDTNAAISTLQIDEPAITVTAGGTVTNSATLYITGAATEATNDYAIWVASGNVQFGGIKANTKQTLGLTIDQGAADDNAFELKSTDVAHGSPSVGTILTMETDGYFAAGKFSGDAGGTMLLSMSENQYGFGFDTWTEDPDTDNTTGSRAAFFFRAGEHDSADSRVAMSAESNIFSVAEVNDSGVEVCRFLIENNGEVHLGVTTLVQLADHDDIGLIENYENWRTINQKKATLAEAKADGSYDKLIDIGLVGEMKPRSDDPRTPDQMWADGVRPLVSTQRLSQLICGDAKQKRATLDALIDVLEEDPGFRGKMRAKMISRGVGHLARP